jgi:hypothetical protein
MIYITKVENGCLIIKLIDSANLYMFSVKIKIDNDSTHIFRELYINVHKGTPYLNYIDSVIIEYKENQIKFEGDNFQYKINKQSEIIDLIDKINTNLIIYSFDIESPRMKN